ncbi:Disease resistance protein RPP13 [Hordeum vulgare]|nr:Disease resistance protein RPP13 [Hordeum vulgare]
MVDDQELMKSEPAAEASPAAIATDTTADGVDAESEPAENFESPVPSPTDAISAVQVDGGQHDDEQGKYFANTKDAKYFAKKHGLSAQVTDRMNKGSSKEEMEGMAGLEEPRPTKQTASAHEVVIASGNWCISPKKSTGDFGALTVLISLRTGLEYGLSIRCWVCQTTMDMGSRLLKLMEWF